MSIAQDRASIVIRETAHEWAARLAAPDLNYADKQAFTTWLRASPVHVREYLNAEALRRAVRSATQNDSTDIRELLREVDSNVVELESLASTAYRSRSRFSSRPRPLTFAAVALLLVCAAVTWLVAGRLQPNSYSTTVGEIRRIALPDGSIAELNTSSKISIHFAQQSRDIELTQGEAYFTVARDSMRPFRVMSGPAVIRAVGTQFSVYRRSEDTVLTVVEGKVAAESAHKMLEVIAGHQLIIDSATGRQASATEVVRVNATQATSWRQHRLIFDNQPLAAVIAEFNRYNRRQLIIEDAQLGAAGISGVFDPERPQGLLLFLNKKGGVRATEIADDRVVLSR